MCAAEYHLGRWVPGDPDAPPGILIEFQWGIPGKTLIEAEYRMVERRQVPVSQGFAGYHYGTQEIHWMMFARDGIRPFEVMNVGRIELLPGDVMVRHYRSYDPDTSSREYRETLSPIDANTSIIPTTGGSILRKLATGAVVAAFAAGPLTAQTPSAVVPDSTVAGLAFLEGRWRIAAGDPALQQYPELAELDIVQATWVVGGKAMRWLDHVGPDGTAEAEGMIYWDPAVEKIRFVGVGGPGEGQGRLLVGTWTPLADGRVERLYDVYYRTLADMPGEELGGSRRRYRDVWAADGPDAITHTLEWWHEGALATLRSRRLSPGAGRQRRLTSAGPRADTTSDVQHALQDAAVRTARHQLLAVREHHHELPVAPWLELADAVEVHDVGLVDAHEAAAGQALREALERPADAVLRRARMQPHVVAVPFDPVDRVDREEADALSAPHGDPLEPVRARAEQAVQAGRQVRRGRARRPGAHPAERLAEALPGERLEEVVDRPGLEGGERVLVIRGHEDDRRHHTHSDGVEHLEPVHFGHLDVQEEDIGLEREDRVDRGGPVLALPHQIDIGLGRDQVAQPFAGWRLVVDDERGEPHAPLSTGGRSGITTRASRPRGDRFVSSKTWSLP
jgi:hypothetical protein